MTPPAELSGPHAALRCVTGWREGAGVGRGLDLGSMCVGGIRMTPSFLAGAAGSTVVSFTEKENTTGGVDWRNGDVLGSGLLCLGYL